MGGATNNKLIKLSGQFTTTVKDSVDVTSIDNVGPYDLSWDGTNTPWVGDEADKLYLQSGGFTSTLKTSWDYSAEAFSGQVFGISSDENFDTPWNTSLAQIDFQPRLFLTSGQFTSTLKDSQNVNSIGIGNSMSADGTNTPWAAGNKLVLQSGRFTSTVKDSEDVSTVDTGLNGISWDGTNTPWCGGQAFKLYLQSGQFTSTIKTSLLVSGVSTSPQGTEHGDSTERLPAGSSPAFKSPIIVVT